MRFEWDEEKAISNEIKHGVSFEVARWVFTDPLALDDYDETHSHEETLSADWHGGREAYHRDLYNAS